MTPTLKLVPRDLADRSAFLDRTIDLRSSYVPQRPGLLVRISDDPKKLGEGTDRQVDDGEVLRAHVGWGPFAKIYREEDTGAWKKRKVVLPDGRVEWRVIRPEFRQSLDDMATGLIDGLIVYDLDRLARQISDLEDLINWVEHKQIPVVPITKTDLDLLTAGGRLVARMLVAVATKASDDASRRISRQRAEMAKDGDLLVGSRPFGWNADCVTLREDEAEVIRELVQKVVVESASLNSLATMLTERGTPTAAGGQWHVSTVNQILRAPRIAGIRVYYGKHQERWPKVNEWWLRAVRDGGEFVMGKMEPIITVQEWLQLQTVLDTPNGRGNGTRDGHRDYPLTGILRCGKCQHHLVGGKPGGKQIPSYVCPPPAKGGCSGIVRNAAFLEELIPKLVVAYLRQQDVKGKARVKAAAKPTVNTAALEVKIENAKQAMADERISERDGFDLIARYRAKIADATVTSKAKPTPVITAARRTTMLEDLLSSATSPERKRAHILDVLDHVRVDPCTVRGARRETVSIHPVWRE